MLLQRAVCEITEGNGMAELVRRMEKVEGRIEEMRGMMMDGLQEVLGKVERYGLCR